jgi:hypothetical protein
VTDFFCGDKRGFEKGALGDKVTFVRREAAEGLDSTVSDSKDSNQYSSSLRKARERLILDVRNHGWNLPV